MGMLKAGPCTGQRAVTDLLGVEHQRLGAAGLRVRHGGVVSVEAVQEVRLLVENRVVLRHKLVSHLHVVHQRHEWR